MHIKCNPHINVAAITAAMNPLLYTDLLDMWGKGCVELYEQIGHWGEIVTSVEDKVSELLDAEEEGFPGVWAYEVAEHVGKYLQRAIMDKRDAALTDDAVYAITVMHAIEFCKLSPTVMAALVAPRG